MKKEKVAAAIIELESLELVSEVREDDDKLVIIAEDLGEDMELQSAFETAVKNTVGESPIPDESVIEEWFVNIA